MTWCQLFKSGGVGYAGPSSLSSFLVRFSPHPRVATAYPPRLRLNLNCYKCLDIHQGNNKIIPCRISTLPTTPPRTTLTTGTSTPTQTLQELLRLPIPRLPGLELLAQEIQAGSGSGRHFHRRRERPEEVQNRDRHRPVPNRNRERAQEVETGRRAGGQQNRPRGESQGLAEEAEGRGRGGEDPKQILRDQ